MLRLCMEFFKEVFTPSVTALSVKWEWLNDPRRTADGHMEMSHFWAIHSKLRTQISTTGATGLTTFLFCDSSPSRTHTTALDIALLPGAAQ